MTARWAEGRMVRWAAHWGVCRLLVIRLENRLRENRLLETRLLETLRPVPPSALRPARRVRALPVTDGVDRVDGPVRQRQ